MEDLDSSQKFQHSMPLGFAIARIGQWMDASAHLWIGTII
jgi:hypothetical protein